MQELQQDVPSRRPESGCEIGNVMAGEMARQPVQEAVPDPAGRGRLRVGRSGADDEIVFAQPGHQTRGIFDAMLAVAALGGHLKRNGDPGWLVLGRGMHDLLVMELGWRAREQADLIGGRF